MLAQKEVSSNELGLGSSPKVFFKKNISREFGRKIIMEIRAKNMVVKNLCIVSIYNFVHPMCFLFSNF